MKETKLEKDKLIEKNIPLVKYIVKKFINDFNKNDYDDMFQVGCMGLVKAVNKYDSSLNIKFSTYATCSIKGYLMHYFRDNSFKGIPSSLKKTIFKIKKIQSETDKKLTIPELATYLNMPEEEIKMILKIMQPTVSLETSIKIKNDNNFLLEDNISNGNNENDLVNKIAINEEINRLEPKLKKIIKLRYFKDKSQQEIADIFNTNQTQISQLERKALKQLKQNLLN